MQSKSQIRSIGIDLGQTTFHLTALGIRSQVVIRKKFSRTQLLEYTANLPSSLIGTKAGVGSHFLGRALREQGHEVSTGVVGGESEPSCHRETVGA
jgi:transposase